MSFEAMNWAAKVLEQYPPKHKLMTPVARFVLLIMANRADEEGVLYPSVRWIMLRTALSESAVRTATRAIQKLGLLSKKGTLRDDGGQGSNVYQLAMSQYVLRLDPPGVPETGGVALGAPGGVPAKGGAVQQAQGPGAPHAPQDTKEETKKAGERKRPCPQDFGISKAVREWARGKGLERHLEAHLEYFLDWVKSNPTDWCVDWEARFRNSIRADWGGVRRQSTGGRVEPMKAEPKCDYCSTSLLNRGWTQAPKGKACDGCRREYLNHGSYPTERQPERASA